MPAIRFEELLAYASGELDERTAAEVKRYLDQSVDAADTVRRLQLAIQTMRSDDTVAPSSAAIQQARAIFQRASQPLPRGWLEGVRQILADLVYDSRLQPALAGFRSAQETVQLSFAADGMEIDLQVELGAASADTARKIMGQFSSARAVSGIRVQLVSTDSHELVVETPADEHGIFTLNTVAGHYEMTIHLGESAVVIPNLEID